MNLPKEVIALLGPDATPEKAAARFVDAMKAYGDEAEAWGDSTDQLAKGCAETTYDYALAAAAIRECEASRRANAALSAIPGNLDAVDRAQRALGDALAAYDALRAPVAAQP